MLRIELSIYSTSFNMNNVCLLKRFLIPILVFFLFLPDKGLTQNRIWTLEDCIYYAFENNLQIKQSALNVKNFEISKLEAKLSLIPNLNSDASFSYNWGRVLDRTNYTYTDKETNQANFGIHANMRLFGGLQLQNQIKKASLDFLTSQYDYDKIKDDITLLLTQAYLNILYNKELLKVATNQVSITRDQIRLTEKLMGAGKLALGNLLEIQAQGAREEITEINYENSLALAYLDLMQLLDIKADTDFEIEVPVLDDELLFEITPINQVYDVALERMPSVKSAEAAVESAYRGIAIAKGARSPVLNLQSGWNTNYSNQYRKFEIDPYTGQYYQTDVIPFGDQFVDNQSRFIGLSLSIPIFNAYQATSNISRARVAASNAEYNYELAKNTLRKSIEQAFYDAQAAYKSYQATQKSLSSSVEAYRHTEQRFTVGMATSVDYNLAKTQLAAAESDLLRAKYDYIFKTKILDFYMGRPITLNQ